MSLWKIAWRSIQQRSLASSLTAVSMALGVALVASVLIIHSVVDQSFRRGSGGYDLIVGARGDSLQLVLNTVFHMRRPIGNIPHSYYREFVDGRYQLTTEVAVPVAMGDNYQGYRVIGTTPDMFNRLQYRDGQYYTFAEGQNFFEENYYDAVVGSVVARRTGLKVGDTFRPTHGLSAADDTGYEHNAFRVVGVLDHTGTPVDQALYVNIEGFYLEHAHEEAPLTLQPRRAAAAVENAAAAETAPDENDRGNRDPSDQRHGDHAHHHQGPIPDEEKEVTAILVATSMGRAGDAMAMRRIIESEGVAQAVAPAEEIAALFEGLIGPIQMILLAFAALVVVVAGIGILVSIYNSMSDRRREIAIMRALGASRRTVMLVILLESILLSVGGGILGLVLAHGLVGIFSPLILEHTGVAVSALQFQPIELVLIPALIVLASIVGYLPALSAYRTDVARSLTAHP